MNTPNARQGLTLMASVLVLFHAAIAADTDKLPVRDAWANSAHSDASSESFNHWNDAGEIPANCASCHSRDGYLDYLGVDGSATGKVDNPAPTGSVVDCDTCHNDATRSLSSVMFPSGAVINDVESSVQCLVCHQGRESTVSVNDKLAGLDMDTVSTELAFINIHYRAAAATSFGSEVQGGYEYADRQYTGRFTHPAPFDTCTGCHDPHSLSLAVETCVDCHKTNNPVAIRTGKTDYDGDDDTTESIVSEIKSLHAALGGAIWQYSQMHGKPGDDSGVVYSPEHYPYFFRDKNNDGFAEDDEIAYPNRYQSWTPRLLKAAYNYQFVAKDPGSYVHNPRYVIQLLYDSLESLGEELELDIDHLTRPE